MSFYGQMTQPTIIYATTKCNSSRQSRHTTHSVLWTNYSCQTI